LFQAKLVKYRNEAVESGEQAEQLTAQARTDQQTIRDLEGKVEEQQYQLQTQKVRWQNYNKTPFYLFPNVII
jgi:hypothetical protein